jgi:steroid delta-isomerase-like uncharacterized protein
LQHIVGQPDKVGYEVVQQAAAASRTAFPDLQLSVNDQVAEGDRVAARWTVTGTHKGEYYGIPATGKQVGHSGTAFYRLENGRIAEVWLLSDTMGLMQQLGVIPAPEAV